MGSDALDNLARDHAHSWMPGYRYALHDLIVLHRKAEGLMVRKHNHRQITRFEREMLRLCFDFLWNNPPFAVFEIREESTEIEAKQVVIRIGRLPFPGAFGSSFVIGRLLCCGPFEIVGFQVTRQQVSMAMQSGVYFATLSDCLDHFNEGIPEGITLAVGHINYRSTPLIHHELSGEAKAHGTIASGMCIRFRNSPLAKAEHRMSGPDLLLLDPFGMLAFWHRIAKSGVKDADQEL